MIKFFRHYFDVEYAGYYQTAALILFVLFFISVIYSVVKKPKKYYEDISDLPLDDNNNNITNK